MPTKNKAATGSGANRAAIRVVRARPKLRGNEPWSTAERITRRIGAHLDDLGGWQLDSAHVEREWDLCFGRERRRLAAHAVSFGRRGWVFSVTFERPRSKRDAILDPWVHELRSRLGSAWAFDRMSPRDLRWVVGKRTTTEEVFALLDGIVGAIEQRAPRKRVTTLRGDKLTAVVTESRARGWNLASIGYRRKRRTRGQTLVLMLSAITRGTEDRAWLSTVVHVASTAGAKAHADEARRLRARGYQRGTRNIFFRETTLSFAEAKREIALLDGSGA